MIKLSEKILISGEKESGFEYRNQLQKEEDMSQHETTALEITKTKTQRGRERWVGEIEEGGGF